jgi:imidazolonepropionase-like amidohydrolase
MRTAKLLAMVSLVLAPVTAQAQLAFTHVTVIDVEAGKALPGMTVVVKGARISAVSEQAPDQGTRVIDATGKFLIPGLWDMHVHAAFPGLGAQFLPLLVANGVTGVREMFSRMDWLNATRERIAQGSFPGPTIIGSGHILDGTPQIWPGSVGVSDAASARRAVDSLAKAGADFIKVYSRLSPEAYFAAGREAKAKGLAFVGHVPQLVHAAAASDSGQKSIEHLTQVLTGCETMEDEIINSLAAAVAARGWDAAGGLGRLNTRRWLDSYDPERCRRLAQVFVKNGTWMVPTIQVLHSTAYLDDPALAADPRLEYIPAQLKQGWNPKTDFRFRMLTPNDWIGKKRCTPSSSRS